MARSLLVAALLAVSIPASAQVAPAHQPAALDALLAAKDYRALTTTIRSGSTQEEVKSDLDWLRAKLMSGESAIVSMLYARLLWDSSGELPAEPKSKLRQTAAFAILYAFATIQIDGARCGDQTAPGHRTAQLVEMIPDLQAFVAGLSKEERNAIVAAVVEIEQFTAARRDQQGDVTLLCSGGMEEIAYNLDHGSTREMPEKPGGFRHIEVSGDGKYKPSERPEAEWKPEAARERAKLPESIAKLVSDMSENSPPAE